MRTPRVRFLLVRYRILYIMEKAMKIGFKSGILAVVSRPVDGPQENTPQSTAERVRKQPSRYMNISETEEYTGFSVQTLYKWSRCGMIPVNKVGRILRFDRIEIDKWIKDYDKGAPNADVLQSDPKTYRL